MTNGDDENSLLARRSPWLLLLLLVALPLVLRGVGGALASNTNDIRQWLPRGFEDAARYDWFVEHFSTDEIAVVSWPGCTLDDPRVETLAVALTNPPEGEPSSFRAAITGPRLLERLTSPPLDLSRYVALARMRGVLLGPDGRTTALVLVVSKTGAKNRRRAVAEIYRAAQSECGLSEAQLHLGGPTVDSATIDAESERSLLTLAGFTVGLVFLLAWQQLRSLRLAVIVVSTAIYSTGVSLAIVYYTGGTMNLALIMLPTLTYVLNISGAVHLVNYYRDAQAEGAKEAAPLRAVAAGWKPCALAALTTAIGLGSLAASQIAPIRMFGIYSAAAVIASLPMLLVFLPAALFCWPGRLDYLGPAAGASLAPPKLAMRANDWIARHRYAVLLVCLAGMAAAGSGLWRIDSTVKLQDRFSPDSRILRDYAWLEENVGPLVPMEVIVHIPHDAPLSFIERMQFIGRLQGALYSVEAVGGAVSSATFSPPIPRGHKAADITRRTVLARRLNSTRDAFVDGQYLVESEDEQLWRISARVEALNDIDYGYFVGELRKQLALVAEPLESEGVRLTFTGAIPLLYKAQHQLLADLVESFILAFAFIALVMIVVLRDLLAGLLIMLPNVLPAVVVFGIMGWCGFPVQTGSVMTASISLGIAVDDSLHLLTWFRRGLRQGLSQPDAVRFAYGHCARAMINTTTICGLGVVVFTFSSFMPNVRFAWLLTTLLIAALAADLILLPAMLLSPLGRRFGK